ncbi:DUF4351 domain-containing protein [Aromatoleum bremense]|uniref:DUF4351 domain-containing protein n=2 Tax=Aromatoleum bremense TaxID=76115 RepID=A0ABX1NR87_9RHOO|nr:DUF4351 domain-containing protein [Aromatoleum bremense]NMG14504.1 DUF4351 domain-containing protein [Aromatoleum bremense]QTQ30841.1 putative protein DUf4351 [Aromatoleum bremense]
MASPADDYDSPWKSAVEHAFPEFIAFYFPDADRRIDWSRGHDFLDQELRQVVRDAELGRRHADKLVRVHDHDGREDWVYIHIEIQGRRDSGFEKRMFVYNYRIFDRYDRPVASLAVLADDDPHWRPARYGFELFGCRHALDFPVAKLTDFDSRADALLADPNPFALVTAAHLHTARTRHDPQNRFEAKRRLVRLLYERDWNKQRILEFFGVLDWMMRLPKELETKLWHDIETIEGERKVKYVTSVERLALERGKRQGLEEGLEEGLIKGERGALERLLTRRFGPLPPAVAERLEKATGEQLELWLDRLLDARTLDDLFVGN